MGCRGASHFRTPEVQSTFVLDPFVTLGKHVLWPSWASVSSWAKERTGPNSLRLLEYKRLTRKRLNTSGQRKTDENRICIQSELALRAGVLSAGNTRKHDQMQV